MTAQTLYLALVVVAFATFAGVLFMASLVTGARPAAALAPIRTQRVVRRAARPRHPLTELGRQPVTY